MSFQQAQIYTTNSYHFEYKTNLKYEIKTKHIDTNRGREARFWYSHHFWNAHTHYEFTHEMISHEMPMEIRMCVAVVSTR